MDGLNIAVIGSEEFVLGFRLAGVKRCHSGTMDEADALLGRAMDDASVGLILVEEAFFTGLGQASRERIMQGISPVVIEIGLGESELRAKVKRAVGVDLYGNV